MLPFRWGPFTISKGKTRRQPNTERQVKLPLFLFFDGDGPSIVRSTTLCGPLTTYFLKAPTVAVVLWGNTHIMKKLLLLAVLGMAPLLNAQEGFKLGAHGGIPLGDFNDMVGLVFGADVGYAWAPNKTFDVGVKTGLVHGFPETFRDEVIRERLPSVDFVPLAATFRVWPGTTFSFGADIGTAISLKDEVEGGFYYRPQLGIQVGAGSEVNFSYSVIETDSATWSTVTFGFAYTFLSKRTLRGR